MRSAGGFQRDLFLYHPVLPPEGVVPTMQHRFIPILLTVNSAYKKDTDLVDRLPFRVVPSRFFRATRCFTFHLGAKKTRMHSPAEEANMSIAALPVATGEGGERSVHQGRH
jgi:hypothetical protein